MLFNDHHVSPQTFASHAPEHGGELDFDGPRRPRRATATLRDYGGAMLAPVVREFVRLGVSANTITGSSLALGAAAGILAASGQLGISGLILLLAVVGDGLDGQVARATQSSSIAGALFDASADRYQEFFILSGLAIHFRGSAPVLADVLFAVLGSFMVSYGSAKAEAFRVPVPGGCMRREHRAIWIGLGVLLTPLAQEVAKVARLAQWWGLAPVVIAVTAVGVLANLSAIARICLVAQLATTQAAGRTPVQGAGGDAEALRKRPRADRSIPAVQGDCP